MLWLPLQAASALKTKLDVEFVGCVKTNSGSFPKTYLHQHLKDKPAGSRLVLAGVYDGVELLAIGYKYSKQRVLFFVATKGAGATVDGEPYIQKWCDEHGNVLNRSVPRPAVLSEYFAVSPRVDNHNQSRQHDQAIEDKWDTQDCWFRISGTHRTAPCLGCS